MNAAVKVFEGFYLELNDSMIFDVLWLITRSTTIQSRCGDHSRSHGLEAAKH